MQKALIQIAASASAVTVLVPHHAWAQASADADRYAYGPHMMWWGGGWYMFFGPLIMFLVLAALVATVVLLVRWLGGPAMPLQHHPSPGQTPLDILKERFARGETRRRLNGNRKYSQTAWAITDDGKRWRL